MNRGVPCSLKINLQFVAIVFLLAGCSEAFQSSSPQVSIEWANIVKWEDTEYYYDDELTSDFDEDLLDQVIGEVTFTLVGSEEETNSTYSFKNGDATFASTGSEIYSVKGQSVEEMVAVQGKVYVRRE
ncbi:hypothetical protein [Jeotgalibacillus sp. R-1-5s-1]|uniref:hypothetical protein n=1 Tax=Jeotgalibacillus sp. R-1-5s-1 TaxID=2555897 RepID=UPI001069EADB|nr:hypothetical protein [Jeotgalibacillus sp. R-1-5s-1]TFD93628.1 hypothetical protein E2491_14400 [Jeotgalibacillus sp. R-1-5s-1]